MGDTVSAVRILKFSGSDPYCSTLASCVACACVKLPVIWAEPPGMASVISGAETTLPSSAMATVPSQ